jgi:hydroxyacylglutathione hydrolase
MSKRSHHLVARLLVTTVLMAAAVRPGVGLHQAARQLSAVEHGVLPARWTAETPDCAHASPFLVHEYNSTFFILRQSGCTNFEKPFLYLLLGSKRALLVDTGAPGASAAPVVEELLRRHSERQKTAALSLLVVHSHGHSDHIAGDAAFSRIPGVRVVAGTSDAVTEFFGIKNWPREIAQYDLGDRLVDIVPIPGHQPASIALYDRRSGILLTGDTLYPGRLYVRDSAAFVESIDRLVAFTATRDIVHVLGAHIENTRTPYLDYPEGTTFQPDEHDLALGRAHLLELQDALRHIGDRLQRRSFRDFTLWPVAR